VTDEELERGLDLVLRHLEVATHPG
jgi:hypothetical protein